MATTYLFEELDEATRDYLTAVRAAEGSGSPGVFAATKDSLPGCGCIAGPIVVIATLLGTLPTWTGVIFNDPVGVALLQTAGFLVGGWLLAAGFRGNGSSKNAGTWVYADPLHLYEAYREQVTITPIEELSDAHYTHNYDSNGNYQNSVIAISIGRDVATVTIQHENRAEQLVTYLNYLAWARGPEGEDRADLGPADLGALARYVVRNGDEPKDVDGNINLDLVELDIHEVPEEPSRDGRALPAFLPYVLMFAGGILSFFLFGFVINPWRRDDAIFARVTEETQPPSMQPGALRAYLIDPRNKRHRAEVLAKLPGFYTQPIAHVERFAANPQLGKGMGEVLKSLSTAEQPVVSLKVTETQSPPGGGGDAKDSREVRMRTAFADAVNAAFANEPWGRQIQPPPEHTWTSPNDPPPIGHQLIAFVEAPEAEAGQPAKGIHFDISYAIKETAAANGQYQIVATVILKADIEQAAVGRGQFIVPGTFTLAELNQPFELNPNPPAGHPLTRLKDELIRQMIGSSSAPPQQQPNMFGQP